MNNWKAIQGGIFSSRRLLVWGFSLVLLVGMLATTVLLMKPASATHAQSRNTAVAQVAGAIRLETFITNGGVVYHKWSDDQGATWSQWNILPLASASVSFVGTPSAISDGTGRLNVAARDSQGLIWITTENGGAWSSWSLLPGILLIPVNAPVFGNVTNSSDLWVVNSDPVLTSWGPGRMEAFVYGADANTGAIGLMHSWADNYTWADKWEVLGTGSMQGTPTAISWGPGRTDVFVRGGGNELDHKAFANGSWSSGWENLGGLMSSSPSVTSWGSGRLDVFMRGLNDNQLWHLAFDGGVWSAWDPRGGGITSSPAAASVAFGRLDIYALGTDSQMYRLFYNNGWNGFFGQANWFSGVLATLNFPFDSTMMTWVPFAPQPTPVPTKTPVPKPPKCGRPGQPPCPVEP